MEDDGKSSDDDEDVPFLQALKAVVANEAAITSCTGYHRHVLVQPLFDQDSDQCCAEAERETGKPERIDPNVEAGRPGSCATRENVVDGEIVDLCTLKCDHLDQKRRRDGRKVGGKGLGRLGDKGGEDRGEETSLEMR